MKNFYHTLMFLLFTFNVLSQTSTEVGVTEGELAVSLSGAANYSIPIKVPPGINGVEPQINLSYNSQSGNGSVGFGWNIGGISTITRIPSTKFHNGNVGTIKYKLSDNYALDGQRLMVKNGLQESYGRDGTEYETENFSNIKVTSYGVLSTASDIGPDYFVVEYPDGSKAYYGYITGNNSNSRGAIHYAITYWENAQGLRISYTYYDNYNNKLNIKTIKYGARNQDTSIQEVNFIYRNKFKQELQLVGGQPIRDDLLLTEINTKSSGIGFRNYNMTYDISSLGYERLKTVTEKTGDNSKSLSPTVFSYVEDQATVNSQIDWCGTSNFGVGIGQSGDFDGDGDLEFIDYSSYAGLSLFKIMDNYSVANLATRNTGFINNHTRFIVNSLDSNFNISNKQNLCVYTANSPFVSEFFYKIYSYNKNTGTLDLDYEKTEPSNSAPSLWGDFDGDYLTDAINLGENVNGYSDVKLINLDRRLTSDFVTNAGRIDFGIAVYPSGQGTITGTHIIKQGDINGDGKNDIVVFRGAPYNNIAVYTLNNNTFEKIIDWPQNIPGDIGDTSHYSPVEFPVVMGDFNGDGKSDILLVALGKILISTGGVYFTEEFLPSSFVPPTYPYLPLQQIVAMDFNGDGKDDILSMKPTKKPYLDGTFTVSADAIEINYFYRRGEGANLWLNQYYSRVLVPPPYGNNPDPFPADDNYFTSNLNPLFTRKSKTDPSKIELALQGSKISFFSNNSFSTNQHLIKSITLGNGIKENITYSPLKSGNGVYEGGSPKAYPNLSIQYSPEFKVVSQIDYPNNGQSRKIFKYFGAITNVEGLGFLGFQASMSTNMHNDLDAPVVSTVLKNNFLLRGANIESYNIVGLASPSAETPSTFISRSTLEYNLPTEALQSNKVFKLKNTSSIQFDGLTSTRNETRTEFDSCNNRTKITTLVIDGESTVQKSITHVEYNDPTVTPYTVGRKKNKIEKVYYGGDLATNEELYSYNPQQLLSKVEKRADETTNYVTEENIYDLYGNITSKKITAGPNSRTASWAYDSSGRFLTSKTDIESLQTTFAYYPNGTLKTETNPYGQTSTYEYDSWFRKIKTTDYLQKTIAYGYTKDTGNNTTVLSAVSSDGTATSDVYNQFGRKIIETVKANINGIFISKNYSYNIYGKVTEEGMPYNPNPIRKSQTKYDNYGRVKESISPTNQIATFTYSGLTTFVDDGSKTKKVTKDAIGNIIEVNDGVGGIIKYSYYANGNLRETDFGGIKTTILQDKWGRKTELDDPSAGKVKYTYNDFNELIKQENNNGITTYKLYPFGKLEEKTITGTNTNTNSTTTYTYDPLTKLMVKSEFTDILNGNTKITTSYFYDNWQRINKVIEVTPYATFTKILGYDDFGRVNTETSTATATASNKTSSRLINKTYQNGCLYQIREGLSVLWQNDNISANGSLLSGTFGNNIKLNNSYNEDGYTTGKEFKLGTTSLIKQVNSFDIQKGNLKSRTTNLFDNPEDFNYDVLDRLNETNTTKQVLSSTFNTPNTEFYLGENGALVSTSAGVLTVQTTNAGAALKRVMIVGGISVGEEFILSFDLKKFVGTDSFNVYIVEQDPITLTEVKHLKTTLTGSISSIININHKVIQYRNLTLRIEKVNTTSNNVFTIDNVIGKIKSSIVQEYDTKGRITSNEQGIYNYPTSGKVYQNLSVDLSAKAQTYYQGRAPQINTYNAFNSPYQIEQTGVEKISFNYNDDNDRSSMFYGGLQDKLLRPYWKHYSGDGTMEIKENKTTGAVEFITYIGGDGYSAPVVFKSDGGSNQSFLYLHRDYQGSIVTITNQAGAIVEKRLFDAWGDVVKVQDGTGNILSGLTILDRGYTGHEHLQSVNIINMNGRLYDPKLHRFLQPDNNIQDPFNTQNYNRYGYVLNNPLKYTDPSGELWNIVFGYFFTAYVSGAYANGGELNPAKWNSSSIINIAAKGASFGASTVATNFTNNYLDNYNKPPELGISAVDYSDPTPVINFFNRIFKIGDSFESGVNQRVSDAYDFFDHQVSSSLYWANTVNDFGNDVMNGRSLLFNASEEYKMELFNNAINMSVYDWAYAAGYSAPDMAASFVIPYAAEGMLVNFERIGISVENSLRKAAVKTFSVHPRISNPYFSSVGEATKGFGFGQYDAGHRAASFLRDDIILHGNFGIKNYNTIYFNYSIGKQSFSTAANPWKLTIFHEAPGVFK